MANFYIVATPIGNLQDISLRALEVLKLCDVILCEDTRITIRLLEKYDIKNKKLLTYNDNSDEKSRRKIMDMLQNGLNIALVSDAGTPLISDPGYKLVRFLREFNFKIIPVVGASSLTAALSASGLACDNFLFLGFLPTGKIQRVNLLKSLPKNFTFVFFEAANRVEETVSDLLENIGERKICLAREITKIYEEFIVKNASELPKFLQENPEKIRGEFVVIVEKQARGEKSISEEELKTELKKLLKSGISLKEAAQTLAEIHDLHKKEVYQLGLALK